MTDVSATHPDYAEALPDWMIVRDCVAGSRRVKSKGTRYLPVPALHMLDEHGAPNAEYRAYKQRASYENFTGRTVNDMVGSVFRKDPMMDAETWGNVSYLETNVDGQGTPITLQAKEVTSNLVAVGRDCLLVDFPEGQEGASLADVEAGRAIATIQRRSAESVINWRWDRFGADNRLVQVVIRETYNQSNVPFEYEEDVRYRVLRLQADMNEAGEPTGEATYWQHIYIESEGLASPSTSVQVNAGGRTLDYLPFVFIGVKTNTAEVNKPPMLDIAETNISHYQVSAEQRHCMHKHSMPQPVAEGCDQAFIDRYQNEPLTLGGDTVLMLPLNGKFLIAQAEYNATGYQDELERLEASMKKMGARLMSDESRSAESGEALYLRRQADNSVMASIATNVTEAYRQAITWAGVFMDDTITDPVFELNKDFIAKTLDGGQIRELSTQVDKGYIADSDFHDALRDGELLAEDRTSDDIRADTRGGGDLIGAED